MNAKCFIYIKSQPSLVRVRVGIELKTGGGKTGVAAESDMVQNSVRGDKRGQVCVPREGLATELGGGGGGEPPPPDDVRRRKSRES
jgi:hypothetical protein